VNEPLALETLAAAASGHEVRILDLLVEQSLRETLESFRPDVVGTGGCTADVPAMLRLLTESKRLLPGCFTVVGGHHATAAPRDLDRQDVDAIVLGPGELTFTKLVRTLERRGNLAQVAGLALPRTGGMVTTAVRHLPSNLDHVPAPRRDLTRRYRQHYRFLGQPIGLLNSARGCPHKCRFCALVGELQGRYLVKHPDLVAAELAAVPEAYVRFADGNTFGSRQRMIELHDALRAARTGKRLMVDARSDTIARHSDLVAQWRAIGLDIVAVGLESIRPDQLASLRKGSTMADNLRAIRVLHDLDVRIVGQFMIDHDFTDDDFNQLIDFVLDQRIQIPSFLVTTPFPGTPLHDDQRDRLTTSDLALLDGFHAVLPTRLPRDQFLRRFLELYESAYGSRRLLVAVLDHLARRDRRGDLPLWMLAAVRLYLAISRRKLLREFGLA
jgi:radical SAM superfamily enzyme YgiQ (UPF0313 family)